MSAEENKSPVRRYYEDAPYHLEGRDRIFASQVTWHTLCPPFSPDGLVEALELPGVPFGMAIQWHPEELQGLPEGCKIFQVFVHACQATSPDRKY